MHACSLGGPFRDFECGGRQIWQDAVRADAHAGAQEQGTAREDGFSATQGAAPAAPAPWACGAGSSASASCACGAGDPATIAAKRKGSHGMLRFAGAC
jgi:hypothetical protein